MSAIRLFANLASSTTLRYSDSSLIPSELPRPGPAVLSLYRPSTGCEIWPSRRGGLPWNSCHPLGETRRWPAPNRRVGDRGGHSPNERVPVPVCAHRLWSVPTQEIVHKVYLPIRVDPDIVNRIPAGSGHLLRPAGLRQARNSVRHS